MLLDSFVPFVFLLWVMVMAEAHIQKESPPVAFALHFFRPACLLFTSSIDKKYKPIQIQLDSHFINLLFLCGKPMPVAEDEPCADLVKSYPPAYPPMPPLMDPLLLSLSLQ